MKLKGKHYTAKGWGRIAEAERLESELKKLKSNAMGKVPSAVMITNGNSQNHSEKSGAKLKEAYKKLGLDYLYDYIITGQISH